jgi:hypothetical protein
VSNEQIQQRIKYLVEHGGLWDDPLDGLRRQIRWAIGLAALGLVVTWVLVAALHH